MILALAAFTQLAASCGPTVDVETLAAVAKTESGFDTNAIRDDTTGQAYHPTNAEAARRLAHELVTITGHSVDLGLMQVNSGNLHILGMSVADAVDPCKSIAAGARVLTAAYEPPPPDTDPQPALLRALSRYNTGRRLRGFANGYVQKIEAAAQQIVPAIRVGAVAPGREGGEGREAPPQPQSPPSWDVYGQALYAREHGGIVFGGTSPCVGRPPRQRQIRSRPRSPTDTGDDPCRRLSLLGRVPLPGRYVGKKASPAADPCRACTVQAVPRFSRAA